VSSAQQIYAWQQSQYQQLWHAHTSGRLPHALLFTGIAGTGKTLFAEIFANALLCTQASMDGVPCGVCHGCHMTMGGAHPNKMIIAPEKPGAAIKVDQVRDISEFTQNTALIGERRVVIIQQANNMNTSAANALLKTLEEPASGALLILLSDQDGQLPATIRSRCQRIIFPRPHYDAALQWLRAQLKNNDVTPELLLSIAHGAPLKAMALAQDNALAPRKTLYDALCKPKEMNPVALAAELGDIELPALFDYFLAFLMDVLRLKLGADLSVSGDYQQQLSVLQNKVVTDRCENLMKHLQQLRNQVTVGINFNRQLVVESILLRWREMMV
jgi:DNA polymerase III subunit delta'